MTLRPLVRCEPSQAIAGAGTDRHTQSRDVWKVLVADSWAVGSRLSSPALTMARVRRGIAMTAGERGLLIRSQARKICISRSCPRTTYLEITSTLLIRPASENLLARHRLWASLPSAIQTSDEPQCGIVTPGSQPRAPQRLWLSVGAPPVFSSELTRPRQQKIQ